MSEYTFRLPRCPDVDNAFRVRCDLDHGHSSMHSATLHGENGQAIPLSWGVFRLAEAERKSAYHEPVRVGAGCHACSGYGYPYLCPEHRTGNEPAVEPAYDLNPREKP